MSAGIIAHLQKNLGKEAKFESETAEGQIVELVGKIVDSEAIYSGQHLTTRHLLDVTDLAIDGENVLGDKQVFLWYNTDALNI